MSRLLIAFDHGGVWLSDQGLNLKIAHAITKCSGICRLDPCTHLFLYAQDPAYCHASMSSQKITAIGLYISYTSHYASRIAIGPTIQIVSAHYTLEILHPGIGPGLILNAKIPGFRGSNLDLSAL